MIPIPFLLFFGEKLLDWVCSLARFPALHPSTVKSCSERPVRSPGMNGWVCSFLWRSLGMPGTGAWSGALIATLLKMPKTKALTSILCGVIVAGFIMLLGSQGVIGVAHLF